MISRQANRSSSAISLKISGSFIVPNAPFIGYKEAPALPFIGHKLPLMRFRRFQSGFTLVELVITLAVAGVLLGIGVPNMQNFIKNNRMVSMTNEILADLNYTRSEALKRSRNVHICKTKNPKATNPVCNATNSDAWTTGWLIWADENGNNVLDSSPVNELLRVNLGASGSITIKTFTVDIENEVIFTKLGLLSNLGGSFHLCDDRGSPKGRTVSITTTGRPAFGRNPAC